MSDKDIIYRQAVIDAFWELDIELRPSAIDAITGMLKELPSAQPDIVRCKDCARYDKKRGCNLVEGLGIATENCFCSYGERRDG